MLREPDPQRIPATQHVYDSMHTGACPKALLQSSVQLKPILGILAVHSGWTDLQAMCAQAYLQVSLIKGSTIGLCKVVAAYARITNRVLIKYLSEARICHKCALWACKARIRHWFLTASDLSLLCSCSRSNHGHQSDISHKASAAAVMDATLTVSKDVIASSFCEIRHCSVAVTVWQGIAKVVAAI